MGRIKKLFFFFLLASLLNGAGPILVDTEKTGRAIVWKDQMVRYNPETGDEGGLGRLSNEEALDLLRGLFSDWQEVTIDGISVANFSVVEGEGLGSVSASNVDDHFTYCPPSESCSGEDPPFVLGSAKSGASPVIFDTDGSITDLIQGQGAKKSVLGFAGPRVLDEVDGIQVIVEGQAVLNGIFIDCPEGASATDDCQSPEVSLNSYKGVIFHEIGHFLGLDHSQVNLSSALKALSGDGSELDGIPTMFPILIDGEAQSTPHYDDIVSLASLYPSSNLDRSFCTLEGTVYKADQTTELQGVNVVARRVDNPFAESTSFVSGQLYTGDHSNCNAPEGGFSIHGLIPGVDYTLSVEKISRAFTGGSSIEPCDPPQSGFQEKTVLGTFSCSSAGQTISAGTDATTTIVTTKGATTSGTDGTDDSTEDFAGEGSGCSLIR
ncbi:MAG: hypothetical protein HY539_04155 [Deltaproteobacteria bacterium]|nr:hypothetical protein [Deltaproteobacteria bacterium]